MNVCNEMHVCMNVCMCACMYVCMNICIRAGHFGYFLIFSIIKNYFFQVNLTGSKLFNWEWGRNRLLTY